MNPRGKQMKVDQPNVQELEGIPPNPDNGAIPKRVIVDGRTPEIIHKPVGDMRTDHHRKNKASDGEY